MEAHQLQEQIRAKQETAHYHKRAVATHRRSLRECMEELAGLKAQAERLGFQFIIETPASEGNSHGSKPTPHD